MRISFHTLGCKLNYAETSTYERGFVQRGLKAVPWGEEADVFLINTCSVTERAEKKCRNMVRKVHRASPGAAIIVTGCYAELRRAELERIEGVSIVFGAKDKPRVVEDTLSFLAGRGATCQTPPPDKETSTVLAEDQGLGSGRVHRVVQGLEAMAAYSSEERTRSFLKVQDGCDNFCAYCTVPFARGRSRNIPIDTVISQAREIAATGIKEVVITGVNTGDFGRTTGESFLELLKRLDDIEGIERYRISSIEPNLITEDVVRWIASGTKFQPHFHIPLQSGSDEILKRVGRRYTTDFFAERIGFIRSVMDPIPGKDEDKPFVFFGIDVIAGLPGETDELFELTYSFLKDRVRPAFIHVFPYSKRPGTLAATWKDQVKDSVKTRRVAALEALSAELNKEFVRKNRGRRACVLWESDIKEGMMEGYTGNYIRVSRPWDAGRINTMEDIIL